jgi:hypothetical protein
LPADRAEIGEQADRPTDSERRYTVRTYCKAYKLGALRAFPGWIEQPLASGTILSQDDICFIWDDFTVQAESPLVEQNFIFEAVTPEWQAFCRDTLQFDIPKDVGQTPES